MNALHNKLVHCEGADRPRLLPLRSSLLFTNFSDLTGCNSCNDRNPKTENATRFVVAELQKNFLMMTEQHNNEQRTVAGCTTRSRRTIIYQKISKTCTKI